MCNYTNLNTDVKTVQKVDKVKQIRIQREVNEKIHFIYKNHILKLNR